MVDYISEKDRREYPWRIRLIAARLKAGYPDPMRPEAVARRKMRTAAKNAIGRSLREPKTANTADLLVYHPYDLIAHLEKRFWPGMSWQNYGEWEIDHIRPIATFPTGTAISEINALTNLRPLWKVHNRARPRP